MKEKISYLLNQIIVEGLGDKLPDFLYGLEETITKGTHKEYVYRALNDLNRSNQLQIIDFNLFERVYFDKKKLIYLPNSNMGATHFILIVEHYLKAKELIMPQQENNHK